MSDDRTKLAIAASQAILRVTTQPGLGVDGVWGKKTSAAFEKAPGHVVRALDDATQALANKSARDLAPAPAASKRSSFDVLVSVLTPIARSANLIPEAVIAQVALESGWGSSELASRHFNFGGLKYAAVSYYPGQSPGRAVMNTQEYEKGAMRGVVDGFATFEDEEHFASVYVWYLTKSRSSYRYTGLVDAETPRQYFQILKNGGYATDPQYVDKLSSMVSSVTRRYSDQLA